MLQFERGDLALNEREPASGPLALAPRHAQAASPRHSRAAGLRPGTLEHGPASGFRALEHAHAPSELEYVPGAILAGAYRVEQLLGEGAMGIVVAARHLERDERVAIKLIRPELRHDPEVVGRFAREARASTRIGSAHVVKVLDVGVSAPLGPYIVMEYLDGHDLCEELTRHGPLPVPRAVELVLQTCEALAAAHAAGITHRDIKPENLFLVRRGELDQVKLLDFGISNVTLDGSLFGGALSDAASSVLGTPLYMSPEQLADSAAADPRADVWSLGAVLYELVSGSPAFGAEDLTQICSRVLHDQPTPLSDHGVAFGAALQAIVDRCLEKDPERRYADVGELSLALLPLAPSRAHIHAQRSLSLLGRPLGAGSTSPEPPATVNVTRERVGASFGARRAFASAVALSRAGGPLRRLSRARAILAASGALGLALVALRLGIGSSERSAAALDRADAAAVTAARATGQAPPAPDDTSAHVAAETQAAPAARSASGSPSASETRRAETRDGPERSQASAPQPSTPAAARRVVPERAEQAPARHPANTPRPQSSARAARPRVASAAASRAPEKAPRRAAALESPRQPQKASASAMQPPARDAGRRLGARTGDRSRVTSDAPRRGRARLVP